jgi:hypothetical protein
VTELVLATATWRQDFDRFLLLRRSLREVGAAERYHHLVALHTEDAELAGRLRGEPNLEVVLTRDLLDRRIERRRAAAHFGRTSRRHWVRGGPVAGWYAQQLTKLALVGRAAGVQALVYFDSDAVALRPLERSDFVTDTGQTKFFVDSDMRGDGSEEWNRVAARLLGVDPALVDGRQFIQWPAVLDVATARAMLVALGEWQSRMLAANAFEYPTYGAWVVGRAPAAVVAAPPLPVANFVEYADLWDFRERAAAAIAGGTAKFLSVQSRLHIPPSAYESIVARAWV